jgi:hypothetical protein
VSFLRNPAHRKQLQLLFTGSFLEATHRESVRTATSGHVGIAAIEEEVAGTITTHRTRPIVAEGTHIVERTIADEAEARHWQLKR